MAGICQQVSVVALHQQIDSLKQDSKGQQHILLPVEQGSFLVIVNLRVDNALCNCREERGAILNYSDWTLTTKKKVVLRLCEPICFTGFALLYTKTTWSLPLFLYCSRSSTEELNQFPRV